MNSSLTAYQLLEKLALKEVTNASFPTHFMIVLRLRTAMNDKQAPHKLLIKMMGAEPVISARIIQGANAVTNYPIPAIKDIGKAITVLGTSSVRRISLAVAMAQLAKSKDLLVFSNLSRALWLHSVQTATAASTVASALSTIDPDEAFFAGLMINMGSFYLLYQASQKEILQRSPDDVKLAVKRFYPVMTKKVLAYLKLPIDVIDAVDLTSFEQCAITDPPKTMSDIVQAAMVIAMEDHPWYPEFTDKCVLSPIYTGLHTHIMEALVDVHERYQ